MGGCHGFTGKVIECVVVFWCLLLLSIFKITWSLFYNFYRGAIAPANFCFQTICLALINKPLLSVRLCFKWVE